MQIKVDLVVLLCRFCSPSENVCVGEEMSQRMTFFLHFLHNYRFFFWQDWQWITWKRKCCSGFGIFFNFLKMRHSHFTLLTITQYRDELIFCRLEIAFHFNSFHSAHGLFIDHILVIFDNSNVLFLLVDTR